MFIFFATGGGLFLRPVILLFFSLILQLGSSYRITNRVAIFEPETTTGTSATDKHIVGH